MNKNELSESYQKIVENKKIDENKFLLGKVKYDDKILHKSKLLKFYIEDQEPKKTQKEFDKLFKKIRKNKKYFHDIR